MKTQISEYDNREGVKKLLVTDGSEDLLPFKVTRIIQSREGGERDQN